MINDFRNKLVSNTDITDLVGMNVFPITSKDPSILPVIIYTLEDGMPMVYTDTTSAMREASVQVDIYANKYNEIQIAKEAIITEFHGFKGLMGETAVYHAELETIDEALDPDNNDVFRAVVIINLTYK